LLVGQSLRAAEQESYIPSVASLYVVENLPALAHFVLLGPNVVVLVDNRR
jgi:hypothetical protein